jgi:hypothetical protein
VVELEPPIELALLPVSDPVARGVTFDPLVIGRSTAVPVLVTPGWVTPVPVEFTCGALGFAPLCAEAAGAAMSNAIAEVAAKIFFMISSMFFGFKMD